MMEEFKNSFQFGNAYGETCHPEGVAYYAWRLT